MATQKDYYEVLGVSKDASEKDIKRAYQRLARKYHPDLNKEAGAEAQFKIVGEAYQTLKDPEKRKLYDAGGYQEGFQHQQGPNTGAHEYYTQGPGGFQFHSGMGDELNAEFFESLFGAGRFKQAPRTGSDRRGSVHVTLEEAYHGTTKVLQLPSQDPNQPAPRKVKVNIPAGVRPGQPIRLAGQGEAGLMGGSAGDLYLTIEIEKHPLFDLKGDDIYLTLPITPWEAALGASISVPTLGGKVDLKIPEGSQGGQTLRLKGRGLPGKTPGSQFILLKIMIPKPNTPEDKACYEEMKKKMPFNPRAHWGEVA